MGKARQMVEHRRPGRRQPPTCSGHAPSVELRERTSGCPPDGPAHSDALTATFEGRWRIVEFTWDGHDDSDQASGRGWAVLEDDGSLRGHVYLHMADDSGFRAVRAEQTGLTAQDCHAVARMLSASGKPEDALAWVERGERAGRAPRRGRGPQQRRGARGAGSLLGAGGRPAAGQGSSRGGGATVARPGAGGTCDRQGQVLPGGPARSRTGPRLLRAGGATPRLAPARR